MQLPIILVTTGAFNHTQIAINQAAEFCPSVVMITDTPYKHCTRADIKEFDSSAVKFDRYYIHRSSNPEWFERAAWRRWFVLADYMKKMAIPKAFSCDGDFMLFRDPGLVPHAKQPNTFSACRPDGQNEYDWVVSAHACYWSLDAILEFCDLSLELLAKGDEGPLARKWAYHQKNEIPGGICDMTALYLFWEHLCSRGNTPGNLLTEIEGRAFDHHLGLSDNLLRNEFAMHRNRKSISRWNARSPVCRRTHDGSEVEFVGLHFQGHLKARMARLHTLYKLRLETFAERFV